MKRVIGIICILLGICLLAGALVLVICNENQSNSAQHMAEEYLPQILERIPEHNATEDKAPINPPQVSSPEGEVGNTSVPENVHDKYNSFAENMLVTHIDGYSFVGCISIPKLNIELPVASETSKSMLKKFPCRFSGSPKTSDLVVGAHNYDSHFGNISSLQQGDEIIFTDMEGNVWRYTVSYSEILLPNDVQSLSESGCPLSIYTCNYDGSKRIVVRCIN